MLRQGGRNVKRIAKGGRQKADIGRMIKSSIRRNMTAKLILRDKEYEVRPGMALVDALKKNNIVPESVIAIRDGEMITDDEILRAGDVIKLIAVISGG
jgi:sulfur carrier protein ThiS